MYGGWESVQCELNSAPAEAHGNFTRDGCLADRTDHILSAFAGRMIFFHQHDYFYLTFKLSWKTARFPSITAAPIRRLTKLHQLSARHVSVAVHPEENNSKGTQKEALQDPEHFCWEVQYEGPQLHMLQLLPCFTGCSWKLFASTWLSLCSLLQKKALSAGSESWGCELEMCTDEESLHHSPLGTLGWQIGMGLPAVNHSKSEESWGRAACALSLPLSLCATATAPGCRNLNHTVEFGVSSHSCLQAN